MSIKIPTAPDSFKGSLTSLEAARIIEAAAIRVLACETIIVPVADGGERLCRTLKIGMYMQVRADCVGE